MEAVGESHYQDAFRSICGGHNRYGHEHECRAQLVLDPGNQHDPNAVKVVVGRHHVGFLGRDQARRVGDAMREVGLSTVECAALIKGGWRTNQHDEGHFGIWLAVPNRGPIDFGAAGISMADTEAERAASVEKRRSARPAAATTGPFAGERVALMGERGDGPLAIRLATAGATIVAGIGKTTTVLVVAYPRPFDFGVRRSATFVKAEELIASGAKLRIMSSDEVEAVIVGQELPSPTPSP